MRKRKTTKSTLVIFAVAGIAFVLGFAGVIFAQAGSSSSECIKCHTDLQKMDTYGAASAGAAAAIAG